MTPQRTEKHESARNSVPEERRPIFDDLVNDYRFFATKHHGSPFISYAVLAELVNAGWHLAETTTQQSETAQDGNQEAHK
jgi:hypothetical protein